MKATDINLDTDFAHYDEPERRWCEEIQTKMKELLPTRKWRDDAELWSVAAERLGNTDGRYCRIYVCETCKSVFHGDYSTNSDPEHDYCGGDTCQPERSRRKYSGD